MQRSNSPLPQKQTVGKLSENFLVEKFVKIMVPRCKVGICSSYNLFCVFLSEIYKYSVSQEIATSCPA